MAATLSKEDVVRRKHRGQIQLGLVTYSYTGDSSSEDEDDDDASDIVRKGEARISWYPKGHQEVVDEEKVTLHDRSLLPGDIVKRSEPCQQSQKGLVKSIQVLCNLQINNTRQMVYNVPSQQLKPIELFQPSDHVSYGDWVGSVNVSYNTIVVRFKNSARCAMTEDEACRLVDVYDNSEEDSIFGEEVGFFPGQVLQGPSSAFKGVKWLGGPRPILKTRSTFRVTVEEVKTVGVDVHWSTRTVGWKTPELTPPPPVIRGKNVEEVKVLNFRSHASVQIGDKYMYTVREEDLGYPEPVQKGSIMCFKRPEDSDTITLDTVCSGKEDGKEENTRQVQYDKIMGMPVKYMCSRILHFLEEDSPNPGRILDFEEPVATNLPPGESASKDSVGLSVVSGVGLVDQQNGSDPARTGDSCNSGDTISKVSSQSNPGLDKLTSDKVSSSEKSDPDKVGEGDEQCNAEAESIPGFPAMISIKGLYEEGIDACLQKPGNKKYRMFFDTKARNIAQELRKELVSADEATRRKAQELKGFLLAQTDSQTSDSAGENAENTSSSQGNASDISEPSLINIKGNNGSNNLEKDSDVKDSDNQKVQMVYKYFQNLYCDVRGKLESNAKILEDAAAKSSEAEVSAPTQAYMKLLAATEVELIEQMEEIESIAKLEDPNADEAKKDEAESGGEGNADIEEEEEVEEEDEEEYEGKVDSSDPEFDILDSLRQKTSARTGARRAKRLARAVAQLGLQHKKKKGGFKAEPIGAGQSICGEVTNTFTKVDILWQDGTVETGLVSTDVVPCRHLDELEFFPGDFVSKGKGIEEKAFGVVTRASQERTCSVNWITRNSEKPDIQSEECSVYELTPHADYVFNVDDIVVRIAHSQEDEEAAKNLPPAGQVQEVNSDGTITVRWVDDSISKAWPHHLFRIEEDLDSELSFNTDLHLGGKEDSKGEGEGGRSDEGSASSSDGSWETASEEEDEEEESKEDNMEEVPVKDESFTRSKTEPQDTMAEKTGEVVTADQTEEPISTASDCSVLQHSITEIVERKNPDVCIDQAPVTPGPGEQVEAREGEGAGDLQAPGKKETLVECIGDRDHSFEESGLQSPNAASRFIVESALPSCHHFSNAPQPTNRKQFLQTWRKEVRLLQTALPQGILVKAFEDRMDMFSVMIEGPVNTPYEDGVFLFDIRLLGNYPQTPPKVHFHSFCNSRLNPNLYTDGKVCLSLLGTWTGKGNEMWTISSNLMQLLVSIQGLILVNEPYYNEAGYEKHRGTAESLENCRLYNEMVLVKLVQSMTNIVLSPPHLFKEETIFFCRQHYARLIRRLEKWLDLEPGTDLETLHDAHDGPSRDMSASDALIHTQQDPTADPATHSSPSSSADPSCKTKNTDPKPSLRLHLEPTPMSKSQPHPITQGQTNPTADSTTHEASERRADVIPSTQTHAGSATKASPAPFALFPLSRGFVISLRHTLQDFKAALRKAGIS